LHWRVSDKAWNYHPKGTRTQAFTFGDVQKASRVFCFESQWDAFAIMDRLQWHTSAGLPSYAVLITRGAENGKLLAGWCSLAAVVYAFVQNDKADQQGRIPAEKWIAAIASNAGCKVFRVATPPPHKDANDWTRAGATKLDIEQAISTSVIAGPPKSDDLQRALTDARPKLRLPGHDRLISDFATELVRHLRDKDIYVRNGEIVTLENGELKPLTPQSFRTWSERHFVGYRAKIIGDTTFTFDVTMRDDEACAVLASRQFISGLRPVLRVNNCRLPVLNRERVLELLPAGYHSETQTLTLLTLDYDHNLPLQIAVESINSLLEEFCFADHDRSKAVAIAAMLGLFANLLLPERSLRPCFIFQANAEGAGKTLLVLVCIVPTLGAEAVGSKPDDDDEMQKVLLTAIREARPAVLLDNLKGHLSSAILEAFLSAPIFKGRKLGVNESIVGPNLSTVFITGNGLTISPDMRRRSLLVELHLEVELAEDRDFKRPLDLAALLALRPNILAALWALVRHWDSKGRPTPSRGHSAFPGWAQTIGGIVEAAGFGCPLDTADVTAAADPDGEDMRRLVSAMATIESKAWTFAELMVLAREHGFFERVLGPCASEDNEIGRKEKTTLSRLLTRYDRRLVLKYRFLVEGTGKNRRYRIEPRNDDMIGNDLSVHKANPLRAPVGGKYHSDHSDHSQTTPDPASKADLL
jgi:hypothetical protein